MIITLMGANFTNCKIGTLTTWNIRRSLGSGATSSSSVTTVDRDASWTETITLADGYTFGSYSVTMGSTTITPTVTGNTLTFTISAVTGNINITVATRNESTGEEDSGDTGGDSGGDTPTPTTYTFTINPTPSNAKVYICAGIPAENYGEILDKDPDVIEGIGTTSVDITNLVNGRIVYLVTANNHVSVNEVLCDVNGSENIIKNINLTEYNSTDIPITWSKQSYYWSNAKYQQTGSNINNNMIPFEYNIKGENGNLTNYNNFWRTQIFTKDNLPNGSVITISEGWQFRPDGSASLSTWTKSTSERPVNVKASITVDDSFWTNNVRGGNWVGFNISKQTSENISNLTESDLNSVFKITLPN